MHLGLFGSGNINACDLVDDAGFRDESLGQNVPAAISTSSEPSNSGSEDTLPDDSKFRTKNDLNMRSHSMEQNSPMAATCYVEGEVGRFADTSAAAEDLLWFARSGSSRDGGAGGVYRYTEVDGADVVDDFYDNVQCCTGRTGHELEECVMHK